MPTLGWQTFLFSFQWEAPLPPLPPSVVGGQPGIEPPRHETSPQKKFRPSPPPLHTATPTNQSIIKHETRNTF